MDLRIGSGFDVHRLAPGEEFWLGGVKLDHDHGLVGHSDADVLLHAISDALLGAIAGGDIGAHFPDNDPAYKGADSKELLRQVGKMVEQEGYRIGNLDATVCLQRPRLRPYIDDIRNTIAGILSVETGQVSVKATTTEKLGFVGREEGVAAYATVLLLGD